MKTISKVIIIGGTGVGVAVGGSALAKAQDTLNTGVAGFPPKVLSLDVIKAAQERTLDSMKYVIKTTKAINEAKLDFTLGSLSYQKDLNAMQKAYIKEMNALMADTTGELSAAALSRRPASHCCRRQTAGTTRSTCRAGSAAGCARPR